MKSKIPSREFTLSIWDFEQPAKKTWNIDIFNAKILFGFHQMI